MPQPAPIAPLQTVHLIVGVSRDGRPFWEAAWRHRRRDGVVRLTKRRVGAAWLERDDDGEWVPRRGRVRAGFLDHRAATIAADRIVREAEAQLAEEDRATTAPPTFREVAAAYMAYLRDVKGSRPSTLRDYATALSERGMPHRRGPGSSPGYVMGAIGDLVAAEVTTAQINALLTVVAKTGATASTVNKHQRIIAAIYGWACRPSTFDLPTNPARDADRRRVPPRMPLDYYSVEEIEALARALAEGRHRNPADWNVSDATRERLAREDAQDGELVRVAAYTGIRRGELLALRWADVDFAGERLVLRRALSDGQEVDGTKSGKVRSVPMMRRAAEALARLQARRDFSQPDDYVAVSPVGDRLDGSALRRRFVAARDAAGLRPLTWHQLRHSFGSLLAAGGIDIISLKAAYGHANISTTEIYLHARPATEQAARFTAALDATTRRIAPADDGQRQLLDELATFNAEELRALLAARQAA